jgi:hypothetical protein
LNIDNSVESVDFDWIKKIMSYGNQIAMGKEPEREHHGKMIVNEDIAGQYQKQ